MTDRIVVYRAHDGWRWTYTASNGHVMADGGQAYTRRIDAIRGAARVTHRALIKPDHPDVGRLDWVLPLYVRGRS